MKGCRCALILIKGLRLCQGKEARRSHCRAASDRAHSLEKYFRGGELLEEEALEVKHSPFFEVRILGGLLFEIVKFCLNLLG